MVWSNNYLILSKLVLNVKYPVIVNTLSEVQGRVDSSLGPGQEQTGAQNGHSQASVCPLTVHQSQLGVRFLRTSLLFY